ncbi:MAG TPA: ATP-binding protein [Candidatus Angelobacter sp.]|nr:ATP-binding protein [Candidatus Angelobacter sp.]
MSAVHEGGAQTAALLAVLCDRLEDAVIVVSAPRRVVWLNAAARELFAVDAGAVGRPLAEVAPDYRIALLVNGAFERHLETNDELTDVVGEHTVTARAIPLGGQGHIDVAVVLRDKTRLRQLETVRRDFVANVSHELRTPVTAIHLLVETLQNGALGEPEEAAQFVERIGQEVAHLRQMVDELLELSLMEAGERPLHPAPVSVQELVHAADRLRPLAEERGVELRFDIATETPPVVGETSRLALVVRNLVHNAIKFTPSGGSVTVKAEPRAGSRVAVQVADTGVGISVDALPRIFERFYKADRSRQRDGDGAGLGLAIARHTVEAHGGHISVESEVGQGTTFTVVLPAALN